MVVGIVTVPRVLREKLGEDGAEALVHFLNEAKIVQEPALDGLAERIERRLVEELGKAKAELTASIAESETRQRNFTLSVVGAAVGILSLVTVVVQYLAR
ncbi:MAG: LA_3696 family protein [Anaerolineae bacterium]